MCLEDFLMSVTARVIDKRLNTGSGSMPSQHELDHWCPPICVEDGTFRWRGLHYGWAFLGGLHAGERGAPYRVLFAAQALLRLRVRLQRQRSLQLGLQWQPRDAG